MTKEELESKINQLDKTNDDEIVDFVKSRIQELEDESVESTVGQGYGDTFREYISSKTRYKPAAGRYCPDLLYDDITPYVELIKLLKCGYHVKNIEPLFTKIYWDICNYLPSKDSTGVKRQIIYNCYSGQTVSIVKIRENKCAMCSEKSGMAQNIFKFLGIDSEFVCGYRGEELHAYNLVYPNGYDNKPVILFDGSFHLDFNKGDEQIQIPYMVELSEEEYKKLIERKIIMLDVSTTEKKFKGDKGFSDDYIFCGDNQEYKIGLTKEESVKPNRDLHDIEHNPKTLKRVKE
jgi:hypothetical protein